MNAGFSYTDSNPFPKELKNYFQGNSETEDSHKLESFFDNNPSVKKAFVEWTRGHQSLVEHTPRLYRALELATTNEEYEVLAKSINSLYHTVIGNETVKLIQLILATGSQVNVTKLPDNFLKESLALYECGIIDVNALAKLTTILKSHCDLNKATLKPQFEELPNLKHLDKTSLFEIGSLKDSANYGLLDYPDIVEKLIPDLMKLEPNLLASLFKTHGQFHPNSNISEILVPVLSRLNGDQLLKCLKHSQISHMFTHIKPEKLWQLFFKGDLTPFFNLNSDSMIQFLSLKDSEGKRILDHPEYSKLLTDYFEKNLISGVLTHHLTLRNLTPVFNALSTEQLIPILSARNAERGNSNILHYSAGLNVLLPTLKRFKPDQLYQLLTTTNFEGKTPLHYSVLVVLLVPLLHHLNNSQFISLMLIKDNDNIMPLDKQEGLSPLLPLIIEKFEPQDCIEILSGKDKSDNPLLNTENFKLIFPFLKNFSIEELNKLFSVQYRDGNTLLHNSQIYQLAKPLFSKLDPKIFEIRNDNGLNVIELITIAPSLSWLTKPKGGINSKSLSEDEYKTKAAELKTAVNALWETFVFGSEEGEVPAEYLETKEKIHSSEDLEKAQKLIKQKLDIMIDKITDLTPWVGTPPENQKEALLQFYSLMLLNFERIFELWKTESNPVVKAGTLIDLAKIELAGRCAAAYQSEIEQTKMILESTHNTQSKAENTSMDSAFTKIAQTCLVKCIETVVQQNHHGNAHDYSQFLYSVGLQGVPDPLAKLTVDTCHNEIIDQWTVRKIVNDFLVGFQHMDFDTALYWFQQVTPDEFGQEFLAHLPKVEAMEQQYLKEASEQLGGNLAAAMVFQSPEGANLKPLAQLPLRKFVSETVYNQLKEASSLADMEAIEIQQKMDMESLSNRRREVAATIANLRKITAESRNEAQEKELQAAVKEQSTLQQTFIGIANEFNRMKTGTIHKIKLKELLEKSGVSSSSTNLSRVIEAKKAYDEKVSGLVDELDINFNPEQGSLSNALKYNRKLEFAKQFFTNNKLNASGALFILNRIGVIEHQI